MQSIQVYEYGVVPVMALRKCSITISKSRNIVEVGGDRNRVGSVTTALVLAVQPALSVTSIINGPAHNGYGVPTDVKLMVIPFETTAVYGGVHSLCINQNQTIAFI